MAAKKANVPPLQPASSITTGRWWHKNGLFSIIVVRVHHVNEWGQLHPHDSQFSGAVQYVEYLIEQNCDLTHAEHADSWNPHTAAPESIVRRNWHESNQMCAMSAERFLTKFVSTERALVPPKLRHFDHLGRELVEVKPRVSKP